MRSTFVLLDQPRQHARLKYLWVIDVGLSNERFTGFFFFSCRSCPCHGRDREARSKGEISSGVERLRVMSCAAHGRQMCGTWQVQG